jgi:hypothetical protein
MASIESTQHRDAAAAGALLILGAMAGCSGSPASISPPSRPSADAALAAGNGRGNAADAALPAEEAPAPAPVEDGGTGAADTASTPTARQAGSALAVAESGTKDVVDGGLGSTEASAASCLVTLTVAAAWIDGVVYEDVAVGGDADALGAWNVQSAVPMTQVASGTWTVGVTLTDGAVIQFRFVKRGASVDSWESWGNGSNRSLHVACAAAAGIDAGTPVASDGGPAVGMSYAGDFNVKPPDAT